MLAVAAVLTVGWVYEPADVWMELFAMKRPTMFFCWYVLFYLLAMLLIPLLPRLTTGKAGIDLAVWVLLFPVLVRKGIESGLVPDLKEGLGFLIDWFPCLSFGFLCARYGWFSDLKGRLDQLQERWKAPVLLLRVVIAAAAAMGRWILRTVTITVPPFPWQESGGALITVSLDLLYAPLFIFSLAGVVSWLPSAVQKILGSIGRKSLMMWFLSCLFFGNAKKVFEPLLYLPRNPLLVLLWGLVLCWVGSVALDLLLKPLKLVKNRVFFQRKVRKEPRPNFMLTENAERSG